MTTLEKLKKQQEESAKTEQTTEAPAEQTIVNSYAPKYGEIKNERMQLLVPARVLKSFRKITKMTDISANAIIVDLLEDYLATEEVQSILARYDEVFGSEVTLHSQRKI